MHSCYAPTTIDANTHTRRVATVVSTCMYVPISIVTVEEVKAVVVVVVVVKAVVALVLAVEASEVALVQLLPTSWSRFWR